MISHTDKGGKKIKNKKGRTVLETKNTQEVKLTLLEPVKMLPKLNTWDAWMSLVHDKSFHSILTTKR